MKKRLMFVSNYGIYIAADTTRTLCDMCPKEDQCFGAPEFILEFAYKSIINVTVFENMNESIVLTVSTEEEKTPQDTPGTFFKTPGSSTPG